MADMAAMAQRYDTLQDEVEVVPSSKGLTTAEAAAAQVKWGKNEIPEDKEPLWKMFAMQFVGTMPAMVRRARKRRALHPHPSPVRQAAQRGVPKAFCAHGVCGYALVSP